MHDFSGIYHIRNTLNDKVYVGQSQTVLKRLRQHYNSLVRGDHANNHLQRSFNKRGPGVFEYSALVVCGISELSVAEQQALDAVPKKLRYNRGDFVATPSRGVHISQKTRARMSKSQRAKLPPSAQTRKLLAEAGRGRVLTAEDRVKISKSKDHVKRRLVATHTKTGDVLTFASMRKAKDDGFTGSTIRKCLRGDLVSHKGYFWRLADDDHTPRSRRRSPRTVTYTHASCCRCRQVKLRSDFHQGPRSGLQSYCRQCVQEYRASKAVKPEMMLPKAYLDYEVTGL